MPDDLSPGLHRLLTDEFAAALGRSETAPRQLADAAMRLISAEIDELGEEIHRLRDKVANAVADQTQLRRMSVQDGALQVGVVPPREIVIAWVLTAREMLAGAPNYAETPVEMDFGAAGEPERYLVTVQRPGKITPHQARQQAEAERDAALDRAEKAEAALREERHRTT